MSIPTIVARVSSGTGAGGRTGDALVIVASNPAFGKCSAVWIAWQAEHVTTDEEQRKMAVCGEVSH